jgi:hypothetical protein
VKIQITRFQQLDFFKQKNWGNGLLNVKLKNKDKKINLISVCLIDFNLREIKL